VQITPSITGIGLVTALGRSARSTFDALRAGDGISDHTRLESNGRLDLPRVVSLAIEAADEGIKQAGWEADRSDVAVIACTSKGSIESWLHPQKPASEVSRRTRSSDERSASSAHLRDRLVDDDASFGLSHLSSHLARHIGSTDAARLCLSSACASGLHGLIRGAMMIQSGEAKRVLIVAAEASVHPLFLASFERLGVLAKVGGLCRPFDQHRNGFLMSEAAAAICLEATDDASRIITNVARYALGGDATHLTGSDPHGAVLRVLLERVIAEQRIDLFHAHGTGTVSNDNTELAAMETVSGPDRRGPALLFSHKAALGHSLGASGLVAVVINCLCHQAGQVPGNINTCEPLPTRRVKIEQGTITRPIHRSLVHAAGFGGPTALVSLVSPITGQGQL
jgi:3-oxoacyl-(acyl-carrier-protein) synthase